MRTSSPELVKNNSGSMNHPLLAFIRDRQVHFCRDRAKLEMQEIVLFDGVIKRKTML